MRQLVKLAIVMFGLVAFATAAAQSHRASVPPRDGCTFRDGTSTCAGYEYEFYDEFSTGYGVVTRPLCDSDGDGVGDAYSWYRLTDQLADWYWTITTYKGNSSVVDEVVYREFFVQAGVTVEEEYIGCSIERPDG